MNGEDFIKMAQEQLQKWHPNHIKRQLGTAEPGILIAVELDQIPNYKSNFESSYGWSKVISFNKTVVKIIENYGGEVSNWMHNGVIGYFDLQLTPPINTVKAAIQIQRVFKSISNESTDISKQFVPKIVLSYGNVIKNVYGSFPIGEASDIAFHFLHYTKPRQIIIHAKIKELIKEIDLKDWAGIEKVFGNRKTRKVEGVFEQVDVNEIIWNGEELGVAELPQLIYKNIISKFDIDDIEGNVRSVVWICAPTIEFDGGMLESIVDRNLGRGIRYRYMIPKGDALVRFKTLLRSWERKGIDHKNLVECRLYDEGCILTTIAVYDPYDTNSQALVMLPSNTTLKIEEYPLVFSIKERNGVDFYTRRLESLWEKKGCFTAYEDSK
jgi:hypothetical protein